MSFKTTSALSILAALLTLVTTIGTGRAEVVVAAGHSVMLMTLSSIDQECHALGPVTINVIENPRGGFLKVSQTKAYPNFNALNTRSRCNTRKLPATRVDYQSAGTFLGLDTVTVEAVYPEGAVKRIRVAISVRPIAPDAPPPVTEMAPPPASRAEAPPVAPRMPEGPLSGEDAAPPPPKPHIRHAQAKPRTTEPHRPCRGAPCVATGKTVPGRPAPKPIEPKTLTTPI